MHDAKSNTMMGERSIEYLDHHYQYLIRSAHPDGRPECSGILRIAVHAKSTMNSHTAGCTLNNGVATDGVFGSANR